MARILKIALAVFLFGAFLVGCKTPQRHGPDILPEEYAVISAVLDTCYDISIWYRRQVILLSAYTIVPPRSQKGFPAQWPPASSYKPGFEGPNDDLRKQDTTENAILNRLQDDLPELDWPSLRKNFAALNVQRFHLDSTSFAVSRSLVLYDSSSLSIKRLWDSVVYLAPESKTGRPAAVSRVAFNPTFNQALVYYIEEGDGFCEWYLALTKEKSRWIVLRGRGHAGI